MGAEVCGWFLGEMFVGRGFSCDTPIWHSGFHDRCMRDVEEYRGSKRYLEQNPVEAKLVEKPEDYSFSSAAGKNALDLSHFDKVRG